MTKYRITQNIIGRSKENYVIEKKSFFGWKQIHSNYEVFKDGKLENKNFSSFQEAESYLFEKYFSGFTYCSKVGNIYEVHYFSISWPI